MKKARQDAWTKDEDVQLAEIILRFIRHGKTQLEAFKQAGETLSRTSSACGFRWNAVVRKQYAEAIELAKNNRKQHFLNKVQTNMEEPQSIDSVIAILEQLRDSKTDVPDDEEVHAAICSLREENEHLKMVIKRYKEAWREMGNVWEWIEQTNQAEIEKQLGQ